MTLHRDYSNGMEKTNSAPSTTDKLLTHHESRGAIATRNGSAVEITKNLKAVGVPAEIRIGHVPNSSDRYP
jgi:hypothetical protein